MGQVANPARVSSRQVVVASPAGPETRIQEIPVAHQRCWASAPAQTVQMALTQTAQMELVQRAVMGPVRVLKRLAVAQTAVAQVAVLVATPPVAAEVRGQHPPAPWFPEQVAPAASKLHQ